MRGLKMPELKFDKLSDEQTEDLFQFLCSRATELKLLEVSWTGNAKHCNFSSRLAMRYANSLDTLQCRIFDHHDSRCTISSLFPSNYGQVVFPNLEELHFGVDQSCFQTSFTIQPGLIRQITGIVVNAQSPRKLYLSGITAFADQVSEWQSLFEVAGKMHTLSLDDYVLEPAIEQTMLRVFQKHSDEHELKLCYLELQHIHRFSDSLLLSMMNIPGFQLTGLLAPGDCEPMSLAMTAYNTQARLSRFCLDHWGDPTMNYDLPRNQKFGEYLNNVGDRLVCRFSSHGSSLPSNANIIRGKSSRRKWSHVSVQT
jgi:hypothetical protein